ncbi:MAG: GAF domain-containing protein [Anaerolineales bacterium]|nr:GAF domain-containing protein [Anaerolineales bacterium]
MRTSLFTRLTLSFVFIVLMVIAASAGGFILSQAAGRSLTAFRQAGSEQERVRELQNGWSSIVDNINNLLITRSYTTYQNQLDTSVQSFTEQLQDLVAQPPGVSEVGRFNNQPLVNEIDGIYAQFNQAITEFNSYIQQGRWGSATTQHQTFISPLQPQMQEKLAQLNQNIQNEVALSADQVERTRSATLIAWGALILAAIALSMVILFLSRRDLIQPLTRLSVEVRQITAAKSAATEQAPLVQLSQSAELRAYEHRADEVGELTRAIILMTDWLRESYGSLERRVNERTQELERRTQQVQAASQVARDITTRRELADLLNFTVNLVRERFGFYHAGVFLVDERREYAHLRAATGEAGAQMLSQGHKLGVGETGLVGYVTHTGHPRIALDVGQDAVHFRNPLLPETRSEAALPLRIGNEVIGALDIQSQQEAAFDEEDLTILQVIADQLATAIYNARLLDELQENLGEMERFYGTYRQQAWSAWAATGGVLGYQFDGINLTPIESKTAEQTGAESARYSSSVPVSIPLQVGGQVIGNLELTPEQGELPSDQVFLLTNLASRIGQILESARLFEEAQSRAGREQTINRLTANVTRSLDTDVVLQAAASELGQIPSVIEASIVLTTGKDAGDRS